MGWRLKLWFLWMYWNPVHRLRSWRRLRQPAPTSANYDELASVTARNADVFDERVWMSMAETARAMAAQGRSLKDVLATWREIVDRHSVKAREALEAASPAPSSPPTDRQAW